MSSEQAKTKARVRPVDAGDVLEVAAFCARPSCRREYRRVTQPGRPQAYCSEVCRRSAEKELRQLRARLAHFDSVVEQVRIDIAAHSRNDDAVVPVLELRQAASNAVARAAGVLRFTTESRDPLADELKLLHDAVAPLIATNASGEN